MSGWTKKPRKRFKHHLFRNEKFCRGHAWDWLCDHAVYAAEHPIDVNGKTLLLKRGQLSYSIRYMADAWNWDKAAVSRFLTRLKTETMIETYTETGQTVITICKYELYNGDAEETETPSETASETGARQERDRSETNNKKDKKDKKDKGGDLFDTNINPKQTPQASPKKQTERERLASLIAEKVPNETALAFVDMRIKQKKPLTEFAAKKIAKKLGTFRDPVASIEASIVSGWLDVYEKSGTPETRARSEASQEPSILRQIRREREAEQAGRR